MQPDLADTLRAIANAGPRAFYEGRIADKIAARGARRRRHHDGGRSRRLSRVERAPVRGSYRGYDIVSMPPPSSGGVH